MITEHSTSKASAVPSVAVASHKTNNDIMQCYDIWSCNETSFPPAQTLLEEMKRWANKQSQGMLAAVGPMRRTGTDYLCNASVCELVPTELIPE